MEADYDVVILGAGAAGLSAGLYTTRAMLKTVLLEQLGPGGQLLITDEIENYPGFPDGVKGQELSSMMERQTARFGAETEFTEVMGIENIDQPIKTIHTDDRDFTTKSIIIATGGSHNKLGVAGEDALAGRGGRAGVFLAAAQTERQVAANGAAGRHRCGDAADQRDFQNSVHRGRPVRGRHYWAAGAAAGAAWAGAA